MSEIKDLASKNIAERYPTQEFAHLEKFGEKGKFLTRMGNLSKSGAFFEVLSSQIPFKKGDLVSITIKLRSLNKIHHLQGEVIWKKNLGLGIQFLLRDEMQSKLSEQFKLMTQKLRSTN